MLAEEKKSSKSLIKRETFAYYLKKNVYQRSVLGLDIPHCRKLNYQVCGFSPQ